MLNTRPETTTRITRDAGISNLPDRELDNILSSGEIQNIYLGSTNENSRVPTIGELDLNSIISDIQRIEKQNNIQVTYTDIDLLTVTGNYIGDPYLVNAPYNGILEVKSDQSGTNPVIYQTLKEFDLNNLNFKGRIQKRQKNLNDSTWGIWYTQESGRDFVWNYETLLDITTDTYQDIVSLSYKPEFDGIYELKLSIDFSYDTTTSSAKFRFTTDGITWSEYQIEPKDSTDLKNASTFVIKSVQAQELIDFRVQGACETSGHTLHIEKATIVAELKL